MKKITTPAPSSGITDELIRLKKLMDDGVIIIKQYKAEKEQVIWKI